MTNSMRTPTINGTITATTTSATSALVPLNGICLLVTLAKHTKLKATEKITETAQ